MLAGEYGNGSGKLGKLSAAKKIPYGFGGLEYRRSGEKGRRGMFATSGMAVSQFCTNLMPVSCCTMTPGQKSLLIDHLYRCNTTVSAHHQIAVAFRMHANRDAAFQVPVFKPVTLSPIFFPTRQSFFFAKNSFRVIDTPPKMDRKNCGKKMCSLATKRSRYSA